MSIDTFNVAATDTIWMPVGGSGTSPLPRLVPIGTYKIISDTVQSLTAVQFVLNSASSATTFGAVIRGGRGLVTITEECDEVTLTTGTFPLLLGLQRVQ